MARRIRDETGNGPTNTDFEVNFRQQSGNIVHVGWCLVYRSLHGVFLALNSAELKDVALSGSYGKYFMLLYLLRALRIFHKVCPTINTHSLKLRKIVSRKLLVCLTEPAYTVQFCTLIAHLGKSRNIYVLFGRKLTCYILL